MLISTIQFTYMLVPSCSHTCIHTHIYIHIYIYTHTHTHIEKDVRTSDDFFVFWILECSCICLLIHSQGRYISMIMAQAFNKSSLGTGANALQPKICSFSYFSLWPVQSSYGIWSLRGQLGGMLLTCTAVSSASAQKPFDSQTCCIITTICSVVLVEYADTFSIEPLMKLMK